MRVTSDLWVSALLRRVFGAGGFAAIVKRGATEAGAVFVVARGRNGSIALFGPAPQTSYDSAKPDDRFFSLLGTSDEFDMFEARLEKEKKFDPDIWVVEIEAGVVPVEELISVKTP
jgi:hypothetical protein